MNTLNNTRIQTMSNMGNFVVDMQADAVEMSRDEFSMKYGANNLYVWDQVRYAWTDPEPDPDPYCYPGTDPQE